MYWLCRMNDFFGLTLLHRTHESTSIYRHDKKNSYNNAKDLTSPERGRKWNVKAASFLCNSPYCVWIWQGSGLGRNHMPRTHRVMEERRQPSTTPTIFFLYCCSSVYFCFLSGRIKYFSMSPIDIIVPSPGIQAQHKRGRIGASQP